MSSPSRSDTNHLMVESLLLQQKGWIKGWETLLTTAGNLVTISSRSFGVADKIKSGLGVAGPVIDNYANLLLNDPHLAFTLFPQSAVSPTPCRGLKNSQHTPAKRGGLFCYLLSPEGPDDPRRRQYREVSGKHRWRQAIHGRRSRRC